MIYTIKTSKSFEKDFAKLDSLTQSKILVALEKMRLNPLNKIFISIEFVTGKISIENNHYSVG